jgi:hypothetical protein
MAFLLELMVSVMAAIHPAASHGSRLPWSCCSSGITWHLAFSLLETELSSNQIETRRVDELESGGFRCRRPTSTFVAKSDEDGALRTVL